jgi:hypothetical protein
MSTVELLYHETSRKAKSWETRMSLQRAHARDSGSVPEQYVIPTSRALETVVRTAA